MKSARKHNKSIHPWRLCPYGQHWVKSHPMKIPPSKSHPKGFTTTRKAHCSSNPSGKDQLYPDEIIEMSDKNFQKLKILPCSIDLGFKESGSAFDDLIAGWTQYWNEILEPESPLTPNLVKALIASESGFRVALLADNNNSNSARGLMQILNSTRTILGDEKGELGDHFITVTKKDLNDASINICSGIRWLFQKQKLASGLLKRQATWTEAVFHYKGILKASSKNSDALKQKDIFERYLSRLDSCGKN